MLPKDGVYVWFMSSALPPERSCSVWVVPSGAMRVILRSPIQVCVMSIATETDVAVPELGTVMVSDTVSSSGMARFEDLVCVNCPGDVVVVPPPPVLAGDKVKSDAVTPVTLSLNVAL